MRGAAIIVPSRLRAKRMVYSMPWRASSFGGGTQQARSAANISRIESSPCSFAVMASPFSACDAFSSVETIVNLKSCPIGGR